MSQINGVVVGIVKSLEDEENLGRIQVYFPWLPEESAEQEGQEGQEGQHRSYWARVATLMSGNRRGSWFMPEIDDEVLVAFEHGDVQHPYIIGFLWNGVDKPPNDDISTKVRRLKTVSGHRVDFDDRDGEERIFITTQGGHEIEMKDTSPPRIRIKTKDNQEIILDDTERKITISTPNGTVKVNCLRATVNARTILDVSTPIARFSGIVQARWIVGEAYTPAPGDTYGL